MFIKKKKKKKKKGILIPKKLRKLIMHFKVTQIKRYILIKRNPLHSMPYLT